VRWVYNILFTILFCAASPWLLIRLRRRGKWREGFGQRFGRYAAGTLPPRHPGRIRLWLHAVSVGEVNTCMQLLRELRQRLPDADLIVSTTTNTGMAELRAKAPPDVTPVYFPVDRNRYVRRALDTVQPDAVLLVEREIWPNFLWELRDRSIPLLLINARISPRSHRAYQRYAFLFKRLLATFTLVAAQTEDDARRLREAGCSGSSMHVLGSMKFDAASPVPQTQLDAAGLLTAAGRRKGAPVIVAGSTHEGEERLLAGVTQRLRREFPTVFLVLVPRHFERSTEISAQLEAQGVRHARRSLLDQDPVAGENDCLLVDSTGELTAFYAEADAVFVGKSLCARGGQNPIEPAALGKAIVFGPHMQNFPGVTRQLLQDHAALQISNETELETALAGLLRSPETRSTLGSNALNVVRRNAGATVRTTDLILQTLLPDSKKPVKS
jgi:3-deoxy-D-manno-octulosonic-acid transferase